MLSLVVRSVLTAILDSRRWSGVYVSVELGVQSEQVQELLFAAARKICCGLEGTEDVEGGSRRQAVGRVGDILCVY